eukprot:CAMPEP_0170478030 /NCGR_PEP_ID=MMETSP0123-20130129/19169_1 /TAXON_ID=182087 /ORGANISM="Favella ehrenbergii, Strain Fehren 1" /LENGTH=70 /DNA_ID=CAMNT_0010750109 /DNA_START=47 /DNA_END=259 /DNA_ORIENTATION=+
MTEADLQASSATVGVQSHLCFLSKPDMLHSHRLKHELCHVLLALLLRVDLLEDERTLVSICVDSGLQFVE